MANKINYRRWGMTLLLVMLMSLPFLTFAVDTETKSANLVPCGQTVIEGGKSIIKNPCGYTHLLQLISNVFDYLVNISFIIATVAIVIGGAIMMTAGSNSGKREEAKKIIWAAVWGLVIVFASFLIVKLVFDTLVDPDPEKGYVPVDFRDSRNN